MEAAEGQINNISAFLSFIQKVMESNFQIYFELKEKLWKLLVRPLQLWNLSAISLRTKCFQKRLCFRTTETFK